uniref:Uncharacterized protein n=1 Tax=Aplanochytrium stocchinoi TaxID=215587 RepID=A0A7S3PH22_9STRA|mmetsp:Transcript_20531/g.24890  ORF Transcript_20531/g.24890 Transcript_20531/m.24890 type:complete len:257 (+) Transcript_20531:250-1020(+)
MEFTKPFRKAKIGYSNLSLYPTFMREFEQKHGELPESKLVDITFSKSDTSLERKRKLDILKNFNEILDEREGNERPLIPMPTGKNESETSPSNKKGKRGRPRKNVIAEKPLMAVSILSRTKLHGPNGPFQFGSKLRLGFKNVFGEYPKTKSPKNQETICNFDMPVQIIDDVHGINSEFPLQYITDNPQWSKESADEVLAEKRNRWMYWRLRDDTNANHKGKVRRFDRMLEGIYYDLYYNENQTLEGEPMANFEPIN